MNFISEELENYCEEYSVSDDMILKSLVDSTIKNEELPHMLCGPLVGGLLQLLIQISNSKNILEIGMFTGYSALKMAQVLPHGGIVHTCELMKKHKQTATKWFSKAGMLNKIQIHEGPALNTLDNFQAGSFDMIFIDADKVNYPNYYRRANSLVKKGGIVVFDNMLWSGEVLDPKDEDSLAIKETAMLIKKNNRLTPVLLPVRDGILTVSYTHLTLPTKFSV